MKIELGDKVKHLYTGFTGIAVARTTYISGCDRISVVPQVKKDGSLAESTMFDEPELVVIKRGNVKKQPKKQKEKGGFKEEARHYVRK